MMSKYNKNKSIILQKEYCKKNDDILFAPKSGNCFRCHKNIYEAHTRTKMTFGEEKEITTGITTEKAKSEAITGCPHCNYSFLS